MLKSSFKYLEFNHNTKTQKQTQSVSTSRGVKTMAGVRLTHALLWALMMAGLAQKSFAVKNYVGHCPKGFDSYGFNCYM